MDGNGQIAVGGSGSEGIGAVDLAPTHFIGGSRGRRLFVDEEGASLLEGLAGEFDTIAIDLESLSDSIGTEGAPADDDLAAIAHGHHAAVEAFGLQL